MFNCKILPYKELVNKENPVQIGRMLRLVLAFVVAICVKAIAFALPVAALITFITPKALPNPSANPSFLG